MVHFLYLIPASRLNQNCQQFTFYAFSTAGLAIRSVGLIDLHEELLQLLIGIMFDKLLCSIWGPHFFGTQCILGRKFFLFTCIMPTVLCHCTGKQVTFLQTVVL